MLRNLKLTAAAMSAFAASFVFTACNEQETKTEVKKEVAEVAAPAPSKSVVVYFSQNGATKKLAEIFQKAKSADAVELKLVTAYPSTYDSTIAAVKAQRDAKQWPVLESAKVELDKYDTVYLGYPIMFGSFAPPIYTFLDSNDLSGKVVVPFCTYGSGGRKASAAELKTLEPNANVTLAYGISNKRMTAENGAEVAAKEVEGFFADLETGKTDEMLMGGFSEQRPLAAEDSAVFAEATKDYAYLGLKPLSVSTQIVAGTNYLFVCEMNAFGGPAVQTNVKIFKPLPDRGAAELIVVEK
jgi:flavodoxin